MNHEDERLFDIFADTMKKLMLFLFLCFPFFIFSQKWQIWNDMKRQDNVKELKQISYSKHIKISCDPTDFKLIITKI